MKNLLKSFSFLVLTLTLLYSNNLEKSNINLPTKIDSNLEKIKTIEF